MCVCLSINWSMLIGYKQYMVKELCFHIFCGHFRLLGFVRCFHRNAAWLIYTYDFFNGCVSEWFHKYSDRMYLSVILKQNIKADNFYDWYLLTNFWISVLSSYTCYTKMFWGLTYRKIFWVKNISTEVLQWASLYWFCPYCIPGISPRAMATCWWHWSYKN